MKSIIKILIGGLILILISCSNSDTPKYRLEAEIEKQMKFQKHYDHFKIDSLRYTLADARTILLEEIRLDQNNLKELKSILSEFRYISNYGGIASLSFKIGELTKKVNFFLNNIDSIQYLLAMKIYQVNFHLDYQSENSNYNGQYQLFLDSATLKPAALNTDSIFYISHQKGDFDSIADVSTLKQIDSLNLLENKLQTELNNKMALGINQENILRYQIRIAEIRLAAERKKTLNPHLFMY